MITLKQYNGSVVTPKDDAKLYNLLINKSGIIEGCTVTHIGGNSIKVAGGRGIICGRIFVIEEETILATLSAIGSKLGRLIVKIDVSNASTPISFVTQCEAVLPALVQEAINDNGNVYEFELATYNVGETAISNLVDTKSMVNGFLSSKLNADDDGKNVKVTFTEATTDADILTGESHSTLFGKIKKRFSTIATTLTSINNALDGKAPTSHASATTTYGPGTTANYGHVKLYNGLDRAVYTDGEALPSNLGFILNNNLTALTNKFNLNKFPNRMVEKTTTLPPRNYLANTPVLIDAIPLTEVVNTICLQTCHISDGNLGILSMSMYFIEQNSIPVGFLNSPGGSFLNGMMMGYSSNPAYGFGFKFNGNNLEVYYVIFAGYNVTTNHTFKLRLYY